MDLQVFWHNLNIISGKYAWVTQVFIVIFISLLLALIQKHFLNKLYARLIKTSNIWDDAVVDAMRRPVTVLIWLAGITFAAQIVGQETDAQLFDAAGPVREAGIIIVVAWFLLRLIKQGQNNLIRKCEQKGETVDLTTTDAISKLLRISVMITSSLVMLQTLGFSISGVLAFGGVGGIAVGFAAKDLLANFFGGLMVFMDRPFAVGEWVRSPDRDIEGTVEDIGWRLTRIRTFDKRPLYVPNATFSTIALENPSRMTNRRIFETVGVRYDDARKLKPILHDIRKMLSEHEEIDQDQLIMVNFNEYSASSLDFFVYCFTRTKVWKEFHLVKEDVLFKIMDIILDHGAEVAFPTTTVHIPGGIEMSYEQASGKAIQENNQLE